MNWSGMTESPDSSTIRTRISKCRRSVLAAPRGVMGCAYRWKRPSLSAWLMAATRCMSP